MNNHVSIVQLLIEVPEEKGGGVPLLKVRSISPSASMNLIAQQKNRSERDAFSEALFAGEGKEEVAGWIEGYLYKVEGPDGGYGEDGMGDDGVDADGKVGEEGEVDGVDEVTEQTEGVTLKET
jgi:hypothetical protein